MSGWNYRVIRKTHPGGQFSLSVHEVYYDKHGRPTMYSESVVEVEASSMGELKSRLSQIQRAFSLPVLAHEDF